MSGKEIRQGHGTQAISPKNTLYTCWTAAQQRQEALLSLLVSAGLYVANRGR